MFHIDIAIIHCTLKGKQYVVGVARQIVLSLYQISLTNAMLVKIYVISILIHVSKLLKVPKRFTTTKILSQHNHNLS